MKAQTADVRFTLRDYRSADFDRLWQIDQLCFPDGIAYTQMELMGFIMKRKAITLVAEQHGEAGGAGNSLNAPLAGFVVAVPVRGQIGHIVTLDVAPQARRVGLASQLMRLCEERLRDAGCKQVCLETAVNNEPAQRLYEKLGYTIVRTIPGYYASHALDAFQMAKRL